jgi:hypothetical protein
MLAPAGTPVASQNPEHLVPETKPTARSGSSWSGQHGQLVAQQEVLSHEVVARAQPGQGGHKHEPEQFKHAQSIADLRPREVLPLDSAGSRSAGLAMAYKLLDAAQVRWRCVNAPHLVALVRAESTGVDTVIIEREDQPYAA